MIYLKSFAIFWLEFKHFFIAFTIVIAVDIGLNLFLVMTVYLMSLINVWSKSDSIATNAVVNKADKRKLKTIGFHIRKEQIGSGYYGTVYKGCHQIINHNKGKIQVMAIKVIDVLKYQQILKNINALNIEIMRTTLNNAINDLEKFDNKNIVKIEIIDKVFDEHKEITKLFLFSKMAEMNLNDYLITQRPNGVEEDCARVWFRQICEAVQYLHIVKKVSHQNIKPENILLYTNSMESNNKMPFNAKLSDCGIAALFPNSAKVFTKKDPIFVISPLQMTSSKSTAHDIYTLGVVLIVMLKGNIENFVPNNKPYALFAYFNNSYIEEIEDKKLTDLFNGMLNPSPHSRIHMNAVLSHPWLQTKSKE